MSEKFLITLVRSRLKNRPYTKTDGKFIGPPWNNDIGLHAIEDTPEGMYKVCDLLSTKYDMCMVTGTAIKPEILNTDRTLKNFEDKPIKYMVFDLDKYERIEKNIDYSTAVKEVDGFIDKHLPPEFHDTSYVLRFSSSFLVGDDPYLRCHIVFLLEEEQYPREIGIWIRKDRIPADASFYFNLTQPIFTAAPAWINYVDPLQRRENFPRVSLIKKRRSHVLKGWQPYLIERNEVQRISEVPSATGLPGKMGSFCRMIPPNKVLMQLGYSDEGENRFLAPTSQTGVPGVMVFGNGYVYSHHEGDPINQIIEHIYHFKRRSLNAYDIALGWALFKKEDDPALLKEFDFTLNQAILNDAEYQDEIITELEGRTHWLSEGGYEGFNRRIIEGIIKDMHEMYLTELSREHIYALIKVKTKNVNVTHLRKLFVSNQKDRAVKYDKFDPDAGIRHMSNIFKRQKVFYSHHYTEHGDFWCYFTDKRIWKRCNSTQAKAFIYQHIHMTVPIKMEIDFHKSEQLIRLIIREACLEAKEFRKGEGWAFRGGRYGIIMHDLFSDSHQWQSERSIRTLKKEDHIHKELPITYREWKDNKDKMPTQYIDFLVSTCEEDLETVELIREYGGYVLADSYYLHKMLIIEGVPGSGKSILIKILKECIGSDYFEAVSVTGLSSRFGLGNLPGKKLAVMSEAREIDFKVLRALVPILLKLIGQDHIDTEAKHKNVVTELLDCKLIMLTNMTPILPDDTGALAQRLMIIRFNKKFRNTPEEILGLDRIIVKEGLAPIINWHLKGLERLSERKQFIEPASGLVVKTVLQEQIDPLKTFVETYFTVDYREEFRDHFIIQKEFTRYFRVYCHSIGQPTKVEIVRKRASIRNIKALFPHVKVIRTMRNGQQEYVIWGMATNINVLHTHFKEYEEDLETQDREEG